MNENRKALLGFIVLVIIGIVMLIFLPKKNPSLVRKTRLVLDTYVSISVESDQNADKAINAAFERMKQIEKKLNRYDPKSEVSKINRTAPNSVKVSDETYKAMELGLQYSKKTNGYFDITVGPLVNLFNFNKRVVPSKTQVNRVKQLVDWRDVKLNKTGRTVALAKKGMILDLGGLAKGFAADEAYKVLKRYKVRTVLIDTGSSTLAFSPKGGRVWRVGLKHPRSDEMLGVFKVQKANLSTSGDYQQYFIKSGRRYHHIINPIIGYPAKGLVSVTINSKKTAAESDILSTAVFSLGPTKGLELIKSLSGTEAVLIDSAGKIRVTNSKLITLPAKINL